MEKNLRISEVDRLPLSDHRITEVDDRTPKQINHNVERICVEPANNIVYCASRDRVFQFGAEHKVWVDWCAERGNRELVIFDFLYDDGKIFALLDNGTALLIDIIPKKIEVVELVNDEVYGGSWAPDAHVLAIASKECIYFVSREFDIISQEQLNPTSAGQSELMSVGWGSKQTQFQGSSAAKRRTADVENEEETEVSATDSQRPMLSWSGDSQCVAVSFVDEQKRTRRTCLWSDEGELISRLQPFPHIEEALTYRSSQNVVVMSSLHNGIRKLVFFERNGQVLSQFALESTYVECGNVIWMSWNATCSILAMRIKSIGIAEQVQWWSLSNGTFSLKYRLEFVDGLVECWFSKTDPHWFYYFTRNGDYIALRFEFVYNFYNMTVFTVKGNRVYMTFLDEGVSPIPDSFVELPDTVCEIDVGSEGALFCLTNRMFILYEFKERKFIHQGSFDGQHCIPYQAPLFCLHYVGRNKFTANVIYPVYRIVEITLNKDIAISRDICQSSSPLCYHFITKNGITVETNFGDWMCIENIHDDRCAEVSEETPTRRQQIFDCTYNAEHDLLVGRSASKALIANDNILANRVECYSLGDRFLVYLASGASLHSLQLFTMEIYDDVGGIGINSERYIESGAAIVGHDDEEGRVWLQMPRGNIEEVYCRTMLLCRLKRMLDGLQYGKALEEMRRHRVDLNLIVDHSPSTFLANVENLIKTVNDNELLNLFLFSLNNGDTTTGRYASSYRRADNYSNSDCFEADGKVNTVCRKIRECLLAMEECCMMRLYGVLLATYLKLVPPQVAEALLDISTRSGKQDDRGKFERQWIEYIAVVMPYADLMRASLSLYDVQLALLAAQYSHQDPMEYLPVLNRLRAYKPTAYQRYQIDLYLERYNKALENIALMDEYIDEAVALIRRHHLFAKAISLYKNTAHYSRICREFATSLYKRRIYDEAVLLFRRGGDNKMAMECAESGFLWREVAELERELKLTSEERRSKYSKIARHFEIAGNNAEMADVIFVLWNPNTEVEDDYERERTRLYCLAGEWERAVRCARHHSDGIRCLHEFAMKRFHDIDQHVNVWIKQFNEYSDRLEHVRREKKTAILASTSREDGVDDAQSEISSETSSTMSGFSRASTASRREKRVERKKMTLTKGSQYEDAGLLNALKAIICEVDKEQDELKGLLRALFIVDLVDESHQLQSHFSTLITLINQRIPLIWPRFIEPHIITGPIHEMYRDEDGIVRLPVEGDNLMPPRLHLSSEMIPPCLRTNVFWKMQMWDENCS